MDSEKKIEKEDDIKRGDRKPETNGCCCYVVDSCGCYVDPCGCYVDRCCC